MRLTSIRCLAVLAVGTLTLGGCGTDGGGRTVDTTIRAREVMRVTQPHDKTGMTLLEGPTFDESGALHVVDVTAPSGAPKVLRIDLDEKTARTFHTDDRGTYTSAQFSPHDGRLYLTDFLHGEIVSLAKDGSDPRIFFSGKVDGVQMNPDDLAFDREGNLYVSDSHGLTEGVEQGRVVRIDRGGKKTEVLAKGMAATNGISFDVDYEGLWVSELTKNQISYLPIDSKGGRASRHVAIRVDGGLAETDSIAVDADGNLYQALHGRPAMLVFNTHGERIATIEIPAPATGLESATNVAITPGETTAYMTVSGPSGGYLYTFEALAEGIRQSNGG
ncbi:SMP-30/gluconolactonase/LRE family protein [Nocardia callitridis]|uniref:SMP-30/gluconolactonase/LRE family protein n=1 Tax=Nocardia callitridis TaxID=648753 RepID=A0ABP9KNA1_9NOCA